MSRDALLLACVLLVICGIAINVAYRDNTVFEREGGKNTPYKIKDGVPEYQVYAHYRFKTAAWAMVAAGVMGIVMYFPA